MNILARYTLKYLWLNKKRTAVTILGVILSSALICGVILLGVSFQKMMIERAISYTGNYHAMFSGVPYEKAGYIVHNNAVQTAMIKATQTGVISGGENLTRPFVFISGYDQQAMIDLPTNLISGRMPEHDGEIVISQLFVSQFGSDLQIGSQLNVKVGQRTLPDGTVLDPRITVEEGEVFASDRTAAYTIVGILAATFEESVLAYPGYSGITYLDAGSLADSDLVDVGIRVRNPFRLYATVPEIAANAGLVIPAPENASPGTTYINFNDDLLQWIGINDNSNYLMFFVSVLGFMITLVVIGSGLVIYNAFSISINERKKQFGMFASVGATTGQIHRAVLFEALVIGLIGIPLGVTGGIAGVGITLAYAENIILQLIDVGQGMQLVVSPLVLILTVLFTAGTILISAWIPARRAAKVSPIDAIRLSENIQFKQTKRLRGSKIVRRLLGFEGELALKSVQRDRERFRTTVFSLMISIILFVTFNAMKDYSTTSARMNNQANNYDLAVYLSGEHDPNKRFINEVIQLPQVQSYSYRRCQYGQSFFMPEQITREAVQALTETGDLNQENGKTVFQVELCAFGQPEFERYLQALGLDAGDYSGPDQPAAILVNHNEMRMNKLYEFDLLKIDAGETLTFSRYPRDENDKPGQAPVTIRAITGTIPMGAYQPSNQILLVVSDATFDQIETRMETGEMVTGDLFFKSDDMVTLTMEMKKRYPVIVGRELFYTSTYEINQREQMTEMMVNLFFYGFLTLITLVGITNIINTIDTNLHLRRREFAMLKSVGLTPQGFGRILRFESLFYSLAALFFGLPLAVALSALLYYQFSGISSFDFGLPWRPMLICTLGVLLIVWITMTASGSRIHNDNIVDTIKEENL